LVLRAAGLSPRGLAGRDLVREIGARRRGDGSIAGYVSYTAFGVLALRAAGESAGAATVRWLKGSQNPDGGFGVARASQSDTDMTGATLQALAVTGRARGRVGRRAVAFLRAQQNRDGGFGQMDGRDSNSQSTSYAVQGLLAVRAAPGAMARALAYLRRLQRPDGSVAYSRVSTQTPVWVTAQALMALRHAPLPLAAVARAPRPPHAKARPRAGGDAPPAPVDEGRHAEGAGKADEAATQSREPRGPSVHADVQAAPEAGHPTGALDQPPGDSGGGVSPWLMVAAAAAVLALLVPFRRRLLRLRRRPSAD
jgi:hypothetical protein